MADPRQMWENLQKGLQRAQQQGQRYVMGLDVQELEDTHLMRHVGLEAAVVVHQLHEVRSVGWREFSS